MSQDLAGLTQARAVWDFTTGDERRFCDRLSEAGYVSASTIMGLENVLDRTEGFAAGQVGSSAMPHKMNTLSCERVNGLAVVTRGYLSMIGELAARPGRIGSRNRIAACSRANSSSPANGRLICWPMMAHRSPSKGEGSCGRRNSARPR